MYIIFRHSPLFAPCRFACPFTAYITSIMSTTNTSAGPNPNYLYQTASKMTRPSAALAVAVTLLAYGKQCAAYFPIPPRSGSHHAHVPNCTDAESETGHLQMITYVKRKPSFTQQEFWDYWETQHAPKVAPLAEAFNVRRYQQVHQPEKFSCMPAHD